MTTSKWPTTVLLNECKSVDEGLIIGAQIQGAPMTMLVDTGSNVTIISENSLCVLIPPKDPRQLQLDLN